MMMPFSSLIGQQAIKTALLMLSVNPRLNGVLLRGERGTAKSTAARALAAILPPINVVDGCRFGCDLGRPERWCSECRSHQRVSATQKPAPFKTLPLGITEDQLLGAIDIEKVLSRGEKAFEPGILARVNQGILYVDEINLLDDHIVDLLLDSAAGGVNVVAREGFSIVHPAEFVLIGTMNPEEGELRPQLVDRFGLSVEVTSSHVLSERMEIITRCLDFEADPNEFAHRWAAAELAETERIRRARELLPSVTVDPLWLETVARLSLALAVDGHRADILTIKAAKTLAALAQRQSVEAADVVDAALFVYPHRLRHHTFDAPPDGTELQRQVAELVKEAQQGQKPPGCPALLSKKKSPDKAPGLSDTTAANGSPLTERNRT